MTTQTLILFLFLVGIGLLVRPVRAVMHDIVGVALYLIWGILRRFGVNVPQWTIISIGWAGRIVGIIGWILVIASLLLVFSARTNEPWITVWVLAALSLITFLLFKIVDITRRIATFGGTAITRIFPSLAGITLDLGITRTLQTASLTLTISAILVLLAIHGGSTLTSELLAIVAVLAWILTLLGSSNSKARIGILIILALTAISAPALLKLKGDSFMIAVGRVLEATKSKTESQLRGTERRLDPNNPNAIQEQNRGFRIGVIQEKLMQHKKIIDAAKTRLQGTNFSQDEVEKAIKEIGSSTQEMLRLQRQMKEIDEESRTPTQQKLPWWFYGSFLLALLMFGKRLIMIFPQKWIQVPLAIAVILFGLFLTFQTINGVLASPSITRIIGYTPITSIQVPSGAGTVPASILPSQPRPDFQANLALVDQHLANHPTVPRNLVLAVIKQESDWNQKAVSPKGAKGLMQLMPDTAKRYGVADPFDPSENIRGGIEYLDFLLGTFQGDVEKALAAYNWGEKNVAKYPGKTWTEIVLDSSVPPETRDYVPAVLRLAQATPTQVTVAKSLNNFVPASQLWTQLPTSILPGQRITIRASGRFKNGSYGYVSPDGLNSMPFTGSNPVPNLPSLVLMGRIGNGQPFRVGSNFSGQAQEGGNLFLGCNDDILGDNKGGWPVEIQIN